MILADTSLWVDHLRGAHGPLSVALSDQQVLIHPFVLGELACGNLRHRASILRLLQALPAAAVASDLEVMQVIDTHQLMGRGIGYIEAHLISSTMLSRASLWTQDRRLAAVAEALGIRFQAP
ncbi:type II toxin-antitoxin system VapC family toxin [Cyanobium sp. ATX 6F1]|uniref:type II toxin-antitoxin system VapC family toxin n=1 Tax=unclassified Cyanobium TaxID=2627006 RepID=UPI0020CBB733|nr:VapC toxin family PIN domain ribonuclease [Cyanobium sp. ATX 6F1]MCP9917335.1 type II toxin-antitoxin system VapC family toxin [Cyanobium sp. ATX 6F1]